MAAVRPAPLAVGPPPLPDPRDQLVRTVETSCPPPRWPDAAAWQRRAAQLRTQVLAAAGIWEDPQDPRTPPRAELFERRAFPAEGYTVEKVLIESLPGYWITGNLFRPWGEPAGGEPLRRAAILNPHGHWPEGRFHHDPRGSTFARCITFARMGYVALCHDMAGYGDNTQIPHRWGDATSWLWGASPLGLQLWNAIRCLDFLQSLPDVDPQRLGCTGESGGGTQTFLLTAVDGRVRASAPVNMVSLTYQGGCICENAPGLRLDTSNVEIAALAAPRPLCLISCTGDWTAFSPSVAFPAVQAVYRLLGAEDAVSWFHQDAPHNYNRASREVVYRFFARWLPPLPGGQGAVVPDEDAAPYRGEEAELRVFAHRLRPEGPTGPQAVEAVCAFFRARARQRLQALAPHTPDRLAALRQAVLPYLQAVTGVEPVLPGTVQARREPPWIWLNRRGRSERVALQPLPGPPAADVPPPLAVQARSDGQWYALWAYGSGRQDQPWGRAGRAVHSEFFLCYNRADAAWAAQDVLTALAWLGGAAALTAGPGGAVPALLARAIAPEAVDLLEVTLDPGDGWMAPEQERAWLVPGHYLPGVLRAGGLGGLLALAAPRPVRVHGLQGGLGGLAAIYAALGAGGALQADGA